MPPKKLHLRMPEWSSAMLKWMGIGWRRYLSRQGRAVLDGWQYPPDNIFYGDATIDLDGLSLSLIRSLSRQRCEQQHQIASANKCPFHQDSLSGFFVSISRLYKESQRFSMASSRLEFRILSRFFPDSFRIYEDSMPIWRIFLDIVQDSFGISEILSR